MDLVICVSNKDCFIVKKTIRYVRKNIPVEYIYIITNKINFIFFSTKYKTKYKVLTIDEETIVPNRELLQKKADNHFTCQYRFGWYYQQFLKMGFSLSIYAKQYYLIWDSDTIPLNPLLFTKKDKIIFTPKTEYHKPYFKTINKLFNYEKAVNYSFIAEHMVISVSIMKELLAQIESTQTEKNTWAEQIINATPDNEPNAFSEFETYGTYCVYNYPNLFITRELRTLREGGEIYSRGISDRKLNKLSAQYDTISIENWSRPQKYKHRLYKRIQAILFNTINTLLNKIL